MCRKKKLQNFGPQFKLVENRKIQRIIHILGLTAADGIIAGGGPIFGVLLISLLNKPYCDLLLVDDNAF